MNNKILIIVLIILIIGAAIGGFYYGRKIGYDEGKEIGRAAATLNAGDAVSSPMEDMPSTNPFEEVVNPFEEAYKNPFE